ncbi:U2 small nuclear ribonucleoprotein auxiliary factor 35 kDa subunit-related protein 2 [Mixophyes fleayi]|uniref:U2 small nuclear ribonucleoprotein auxiliary factor 35 kDa subunit-related protein 2 n=1 Tax=Mixophyes fleayi TaxID=3061075 RepID=UPI003F4D9D73
MVTSQRIAERSLIAHAQYELGGIVSRLPYSRCRSAKERKMAASVLGSLEPVHLNHKKIRAMLKKERRRKKRQALAKLREAEENKEEPLAEDEEEDEMQHEIERQRLHEEWLLREQKAQEEFLLQKEKEEADRKQEAEVRRLIDEWRQQEMEERAKEPEEVKRREREEAVQKMLDEAESQLENGGTWHNPEAPDGFGTEKDRDNCPFYLKTGACRFGERCSRRHCYPSSSPTLLIRGMFVTFGMEQCRRDDYDTDASLEYGDEEIYQQFLDFYADVVPEFKSVGKVIQFKVSCNCEPHLRGNVYVQYQTEEECLQAFTLFNGRWYAARQLQCEFSPVIRWRSAICGLFERQKCPRGKHCNFLHVFRNPNNEFWEASRDLNMSPDRSNFSERRDRTGRSDDHWITRRHHSPSLDSKRNGDSSRRKISHHKSKKKHSAHRSRSRERRSRSRGREKHKHKIHSRHSRSESHSRKRRSRSRSRSSARSSVRKRRSRSRSRSSGRKRRSRSRSRSSGRKRRSRSRSRSSGRKRRSRSRSRSSVGKRRSRSRSRSSVGKRRSRSRSRSSGRKSRSHSRSRSHGKKTRSRSRSRSLGRKNSSHGKKKSRSRSRSRSSGKKSRSRSRSRSYGRRWSKSPTIHT